MDHFDFVHVLIKELKKDPEISQLKMLKKNKRIEGVEKKTKCVKSRQTISE